ncbi:MAG TPA: metal-dependent transcriptional regulator [Chitinophagaceae bacterium]|nr:metal-dependent transcriptional regulator [Chitinophagaceae bacterium]HNF47996.1 metal-dependent transcriptional regulator [Chitinophagales bacterium]HNL84286.1 metal-dependent transcriptional regulator [Chitinophagales bacterium]
MLTAVEENYLKYIFQLLDDLDTETVKTNDLAYKLEHSPATVTDMLKKLSDKKLVQYKKYYGASLTKVGRQTAIKVLRKHRLWETFLVRNLKFTWDKVHEIAEQLEHVQSDELVERLDEFLGFPKFDPHGDPIPDKHGYFHFAQQIALTDAKLKENYILAGVNDASTAFLVYLNKIKIQLNDKIRIIEKEEFDDSVTIVVNDRKTITISHSAAGNMWVKKV